MKNIELIEYTHAIRNNGMSFLYIGKCEFEGEEHIMLWIGKHNIGKITIETLENFDDKYCDDVRMFSSKFNEAI